MTDQLNIQLSAYVDDALLDEECELLVRRMCSDEKLQETVRRYCLIGDALRGDNVAARLLLARRISQELEQQEQLVEPAVERAAGTGGWQRLIKPVTGLAVAATVATVAVLSLQSPLDPAGGVLPSTTTAVIDTVDGATTLRPDGGPQIILPEVLPASMTQSRMDRYLIRHRSYASGLGGQTIMGFRDVSNYVDAPTRSDTGKEAEKKASKDSKQ